MKSCSHHTPPAKLARRSPFAAPLALSLLWCFCNLASADGAPQETPSISAPAAPASAETAQTLEQLIALALHDHPAIQAQEAQKRIAQAGLDSANWQFFPTPSFSIEKATASATDTSYQGDDRVATVRLQQTLWAGGRLTAGKNQAKANLAVSQATFEDTRQQLALRVVQTYSDWLTAHLKTQANEKSLVTHLRLAEQIKRRVEQGVSAESDLILAKGRLKSVAADISLARTQKEVALARLTQLVGRPVDDAALRNAVAIFRQVDASLPTLLEQALAINPAIQKAQAQAQVQEAMIAERRADLSPEVYLRAERQYGNYTVRNAEPENRLFIGLSSRFGAGLATLSNIESAKAQYQAALTEVEVQTRSVREQVLADYALTTSSGGRLAALHESLQATEELAQSYNRQFLAGRKTWLDVMNAARELAQTEIQLADIQSAQVVASWRLLVYARGIATVIGSTS